MELRIKVNLKQGVKQLDWYTILVYIVIVKKKIENYHVVFTGKVWKSIRKLPKGVLQRFFILAEQLSENGPIAANWPNYSKLSKNSYHCHLT